MPRFLLQRNLYEVRERHSNMYSWTVMLFSNILSEIPYHIVLGVIVFSIFNYTVFGTDRSSEDQGLILLFCIYFYVFAGTFAHMVMAPLPDVTTAGGVVTILFSMMVIFAGVFQTPDALADFWIFMYRVSPLTYLVGGMAASGLSGKPIVCSSSELATFQPPPPPPLSSSGESVTCGTYLGPFLRGGGAAGTLLNPDATADCSYCPLRSADQVLARSWIFYEDRWFDWALGFAYIGFNISAVFAFYYLFRLGGLKACIKKLSGLGKYKRP